MSEPDSYLMREGFTSGFVAVVGKPNVGKSTLMNFVLGEKLAIVSPKPQTTRGKQLGILTNDVAQIIFVDTPGIHTARTKLDEFMVESAVDALRNADAVLFIVDLTAVPNDDDRLIATQLFNRIELPVILALNKADLLAKDTIPEVQSQYSALMPNADLVSISAATGENVNILLDKIIACLPKGPYLFPPDQLTDTYIRDNVAEIIREKILVTFEDEVPHSVAVQVDEFKERTERLTYIRATIYVEKDSQKGIIIGDKGRKLKLLGASVRKDIEAILGTSIYLDLWVKVLRNWRKDDQSLRRLGYYHKT